VSGRRRAALAAVALTGAACASLFTALGRRADGIKMPHAKHVAAKVDCLACHETIFDAEVLSEADLPREKVCLKCHREEKEKGNCGMCHLEPDRPGTYPHQERAVVMSHAKHLELKEVNEDCRTCHLDLPEPGRPALAAKPPMASCTNCHRHEQEYASGGCNACHLDLSRYALRPLSGFSHQGDYLRSHPADARARGAACATCHEQTFCAECHARTAVAPVAWLLPERVDRLLIHRGDFVGRHDIEAKADSATCSRCHGTSFCADCHATRGLLSLSGSPVDPHPQGFSDPRSAAFHGPVARRDIATCAGCHDQGASSTCVQCHRVGGVGGNPHPASWLARHGVAELSTNSMCLACHP